MKWLAAVMLVVSAQSAWAQDGGVPQDAGAAPPPTAEEVEAILRELEQESQAAGAPSPALEARTEETLPPWTDVVVPVMQLRLRPFLRLGHPTSQRQPEVDGQVRGWLGAEVHPALGVSGRLVLSVHQQPPRLTMPGPDLLLDAWVQWSYAALGGEVAVRAGRQAMHLTPLIFDENDWLLLPPRFDGLSARLTRGHFFAQALAAVEAIRTIPPAGSFPDVNLVTAVQAGIADGPARQVELHAIARAPRLPVHGDSGPTGIQEPLVSVGGNAMWDWQGLHGRAALEVQQGRFAAPSLFAPPVAMVITAGYAPQFDWAMGAYGMGGVRAASGQPMRYLPGLGTWSGWDGVADQPFNPLYGRRHGVLGEMDLARMENILDVWGRVGLVRGALTNLSVTLHQLSLLNPMGAWFPAVGDTPYQRAGEGTGNPLIGHEVDVQAEAMLTRHISVGGSVGLLVSGAKAREAGFSAFAHTGFLTLQLTL